jgi:hypothetical protein
MEEGMTFKKRLREAEEKYPDVDVSIRRGTLYIDGIPENEFIEKSLSATYFLPRDEFSTAYELEEPAETIRKKGMVEVETTAGKKKRESQ